MDIKEQLQNLAQDLVNLEIVTIVKPNITGRKMPDPKIALTEICNKYSIKLAELDAEVKIADDKEWGGIETFNQIWTNSDVKISALKKEMKELENLGKTLSPEHKANLWMLYRIKTITEAILRLYVEQEDGRFEVPPSADNLVLIRKSWELGIEEIAMKTVIQLDGDVITRVQESYATEKHATVQQIHNLNVSTSLKFWKTLVEILESFVTGLVKLILPKK